MLTMFASAMLSFTYCHEAASFLGDNYLEKTLYLHCIAKGLT